MSSLCLTAAQLDNVALVKLSALSRTPRRLKRSPWAKVLDELAFLCDDLPVGDSATSIMAEEAVGALTFWLATSDDAEAASKHLSDVLQHLSTASEAGVRQVTSSLLELCLSRSEPKILNYIEKLSKLLGHARTDVSAAQIEIATCLQQLEDFRFPPVDSTETLCQKAYDLRSTTFFEQLQQFHATDPQGESRWPSIRHFIGRLGAWHRAVDYLVRYAIETPNRMLHFEVKPVHRVDAHVEHVSAVKDGSVDRPLQLLLPSFDKDERRQRLRTATGINEDKLDAKYRDTRQLRHKSYRVHGEVTILEHVRRRQIEFAFGEKYIGCSKPSCYCCDLYMQWHPVNPSLRACHNKLWTAWGYPQFDPDNDGEAQRWRDFSSYFATYIENELKHTVLAGSPVRRHMFDSTTALGNTTFRA